MLTKLPNGSHLDLATVKAVRIAELIPRDDSSITRQGDRYPIKDRVIIDYVLAEGGDERSNSEIVYFDSPEEAKMFASKLALMVNMALKPK